jgi:hypothetical protein
VREGLLAAEMARKLLGWKHSGFSVHNGKPLRREDADGLERVAQYIIRNPFSEQGAVGSALSLSGIEWNRESGIGTGLLFS